MLIIKSINKPHITQKKLLIDTAINNFTKKRDTREVNYLFKKNKLFTEVEDCE